MRIEGDIRAKDTSFWEFLQESSGMYIIPALQRPYTWGKGHINELFTDIKDATGPYYIGSVVIIDRDRNTNRDQIIDGQQRLTTLSLILSGMLNLVDSKKNFEEFREDVAGMLYKMTLNGKKIPRLSFTNEKSEEAYLSVLKGDLDNLNIASQKVFKDASNQIQKLLKEYSPKCKVSEMEKLLENIKSLQMVLIECKNYSSAFDLFESINATGVSLASNDLIKNRLFQISYNTGDKSLREAEQMWSEIEMNLDFDSSKIKRFIRHQWLSSRGYTSHKRLFKDFEKKLENSRNPEKEASSYLQGLLIDSKIYKGLLNADTESLSNIPKVRFEKDEIKKSLEFLGWLGVDQVYSVLLFLNRTSNTFKKDVNRLVSFQFLYKHVPGSPSIPEKIFADFVEGKISKNDMFLKLQKMCEKHKSDFSDSLTKKVYYREGKSGDIQFILEKYIINYGDGVAFSEPTIEHIIAKSNNDHVLQDYIHLIGNLTILEKTDNGSLQDKPFVEKLQIYSKLWNINKKIKKYSFEKDPVVAIKKRSEDIASGVFDLFMKVLVGGKWPKNK